MKIHPLFKGFNYSHYIGNIAPAMNAPVNLYGFAIVRLHAKRIPQKQIALESGAPFRQPAKLHRGMSSVLLNSASSVIFVDRTTTLAYPGEASMKPVSRYAVFLLLALLFAAVPVHAAGLPDTGQDTCYDDFVADGVAASNAASIARDAGTHPRQDCRYGRDAAAAAGALTKTGAGAKGFDYNKIANNGTTLAAGAALGAAATDWACTKDNITGLTWEVKVNDIAHLRHRGHTYTWYNSNAATNGGDAGGTGGNSCNATLPGNLCNTEAFVTAVNAAALCSYTDWRMPTKRELLTWSCRCIESEHRSGLFLQYPRVGVLVWFVACSCARCVVRRFC